MSPEPISPEPMNPAAVEALAAALHAARARGVPAATDGPLPQDPAEAYAVQAAIVRRAGGGVRGWKVTALKPADQARYGGDRPVAGPLLDGTVHAAPAALAFAAFLAPILECEFAFRLGRDLPARATPYSEDEVAAAVAAILPAFEIADGRVPATAPGALRLADSMGNGAFVTGPAWSDWRAIDRRGPVRLRLDGAEAAVGSGAVILGDPLKAVVALANAQPLCGPLLAGQIVTTGSATSPLPVTGPCRAEADFGPLGTIVLTLT
ncbi:2-keto-4-pentenoate hydratase [Aquabacter spiritensis]|uniref:2-keto-4-pentenoate hydratase n=1 Tax=Aquabacter spiritensis TaxID=933073 RepID=A0A4V2UY20_9HYPH|nr:2-keto-4-pentenoate hydratase [Aquabacter spiritensis]TCT05708.1 2-keto-4-pentenoate hydratase [Aquabacter spiritensis]